MLLEIRSFSISWILPENLLLDLDVDWEQSKWHKNYCGPLYTVRRWCSIQQVFVTGEDIYELVVALIFGN